MEILDQIKGQFEGEQSTEFIAGLTKIASEHNLKLLDEAGEQALFTDNTKKAVDRTLEGLGKLGLQPIMNENNEEEKYYNQFPLHLKNQIAKNKELEVKITEVEKAQKTGDPKLIEAKNEELSELRKLLKDEQSARESDKATFEDKWDAQRKADSINNGLTGIKYKQDASTEDIESAKEVALFKVNQHPTKWRDGIMIFVDEHGEAKRDEKGEYITPQKMLKGYMSYVIDSSKPTSGTGTKKEDGEVKTSDDFHYNNEPNQSELYRSLQKFAGEKGKSIGSLQAKFQQIVKDHNLK